MATLVGFSDDTAFTTNTFTNFGAHAANSGVQAAGASGTVDALEILINDWGGTTSLRLAIYEGTTAGTTTTLVGTALFTSAQSTGRISSAPEAAFSIVSGRFYRPKFFFDPIVGDPMIQILRDGVPTVASGQGISTSLSSGTFATPDDPLNTAEMVNEQQDGIFFYNVDGTITPAGTTGTLSETLEDAVAAITGNVASSGVTGTSAVTLDGATVAAAGNIQTSISGTLSEALDDATSAAAGIVWEAVTFVGPAPDLEDTESFYELAINDLGFTAEVGDVLHFTPDTGLTVDGQFIPTVDPAATVSGQYYIYDTSLATPTAKSTYLIDERVSGEVLEALEVASLSAVGALSQNTTGTLSEALEDTSSTASGVLTVSGTLSTTLEASVSTAAGTQGSGGNLSQTLSDTTLVSTGELTHGGTVVQALDNVASTASGTLEVTGTLSETLDNGAAASAGELLVTGTLSEVLDATTLSALGTLGNVLNGILSEVTEDVAVTSTGLVGLSGSATNSLDGASSIAAGGLEVSGTVSEALEDTVSTSSAEARVIATLSSTLANMSSSGDGTVASILGSVSTTLEEVALVGTGTQVQNITGSLVETLGNVSLAATGAYAENITATLSVTFADISTTTLGDAGVAELILEIVARMHLWLPENNVLTDLQMQNIVSLIITTVGSAESDEPEILCKALRAAAQLNKAKAATSYGLTKEKVDRAEYTFATGGKSPKDLWQDYIDSLADICPLFGYTGAPSSVGIKVNSGPTIDPLKYCRAPTDDLY